MRSLHAALLSLALVGLAAGPAEAGSAQRCNGERRLCDRTLDDIVLPATHNSMSAESLGWQFPNQQVGIPDQLRDGIRGFLIDTYYGVRHSDGTVVNAPAPASAAVTRRASELPPAARLIADAARRRALASSGPAGEREVYLCHVRCELGATPLVDALRAMRRFLAANPDEVLVIVNEDYVTPRSFAKVVTRSGLDRYVFRGRPGPRWPTLREMITRRQQVVLLAESAVAGVPWYHPAYEGILQETPYDWPKAGQLTDPSQLAASCLPNRGGRRGSLFLLNHWSPPFPASDATARLVNKTGALVRRAMACRAARGRVPNLLAVDRYRTGGVLSAARKLNLRAP